MAPSVVLITGCSSGIGRALCWAFHRRGDRVVATARDVEALEALSRVGMCTLALDVTNAEAITQVVDTVVSTEGRLDVVVNNAGFGQFGPLMDIDRGRLQAQFQTNVFAPLAVAQQVAPMMKSQGSGRIVNVGSISGVVTTPFAGAYCASKAALHSLSEALRMELAPFGIRVITIQPGAIASSLGESAKKALDGVVSKTSWYAELADDIQARSNASQVDATPTDDFAVQIVEQVMRSNPPAVLRRGKKSLWLPLLKRVLPRSLLEHVLMRRFGLLRLNDSK
ncbi:MAG: SDR family oxidoreductase [Cyanobacteria bacterium P01_F01_bin.53]